jgi:small subunit ribosomal protein S6
MTTYELTLVLPTDKEKQIFDRVKKILDTAGAKITKNDEWGKRTLGYPINKQTEAVYYMLTVDMDTEKTNAVNRVLENDDDIMRHMIVVARKAQKVEKTEAKKEKKEDKVEKTETKAVKSESKAKTQSSKGKSKEKTSKGKSKK